MPQIGTISLNDSTASPFTYDPLKIDGNIASFHETDRFSGVAVGESLMTISVQRAANGGKVNKVRIKLIVPYLDGTNVLKYSLTSDHTFLFPVGCSQLERTDILAFAKNSLANTDVIDAVTTVANFW